MGNFDSKSDLRSVKQVLWSLRLFVVMSSYIDLHSLCYRI